MNLGKFKYIALAVTLSTIPGFTVQAQQKLSLDDAVTLAKNENPELKATSLGIPRAAQQRTIARSMLLPTVTASGVVNHYFALQPFFGFGEGATDGKIPYGRFG